MRSWQLTDQINDIAIFITRHYASAECAVVMCPFVSLCVCVCLSITVKLSYVRGIIHYEKSTNLAAVGALKFGFDDLLHLSYFSKHWWPLWVTSVYFVVS